MVRSHLPFRFLSPLLLFLIAFSLSLLYAQDVQQIINQTLAAHGGSALSQVNSSTTTGLWTDYRLSPSLPLPATLKSLGKATRLEYTDAQGPTAQIRNGALYWDVRGTQAKQYAKQPPALQEVFFNPSLWLVSNLVTPDFAFYTTTTLRGHAVYVLWKAYWTAPLGSSNYRGTQEFIYVYIDSITYRIAQIDYTYGSDYNRLSFRFDNYAVVSGIAVPMTVTHSINNATVWQFQAQTATFNPAANPQDFARPY